MKLYEPQGKRQTWTEDVAKENLAILKDYATRAQTWRHNANKYERARYGFQYSNPEIQALKAFRVAPLAISVLTAICDTADAMMLSSKPVISVAPRIHPTNELFTSQSKSIAGIMKFNIQNAWYRSLGALQFDKAIRDYGNVGHGLMYVAPRMEEGEFLADIKNLPWRNFYPDPASKSPLYDDMDNQVYAFRLSKKAAWKWILSFEPDLSYADFEKEYCKESEAFNPDMPSDNMTKADDTVLFTFRATLESELVYSIYPLKGEIGGMSTTVTELTPGLKARDESGEIEIVETRQLCQAQYISIGKLGFKKTYPIRHLPIVGMVYEHLNDPYPIGRVQPVFPLQRALNRFITTSMINASLTNNVRIMAEEHSIINQADFVKNSSLPGAFLYYKLNMPGTSVPPQIIAPTPMGDAALVMPRYLTTMMEYMSGIFSTMMGSPERAPDVFSTVASLQSAGAMRIKRRMQSADIMLSKLGEITASYYQHYAPFNGYTNSFFDAKNPDQFVVFNKVTQEGVGADTKVIIDPNTDLRKGIKDVRFVSEGSSGYEAATESLILTQLATTLGQQGLVPAILERLNISGIDKYLKENNELGMSQQKIAQLEQTVQELNRETKSQYKQIMQSAINLQSAIAKGKYDTEYSVLMEKIKANVGNGEGE